MSNSPETAEFFFEVSHVLPLLIISSAAARTDTRPPLSRILNFSKNKSRNTFGMEVPQTGSAMRKRDIKIAKCKRMIFHNFQKRDLHCDITLLSADGKTRKNAHRAVLAEKIKNIESSMRESAAEIQTTMDASTLQCVVNFCYTHRVYFDGEEQANGVLKAATEYNIPDLVDKCQTFLHGRQNPPSGPEKLIIVGELREETCFSAAMLERQSLKAKWAELPDIIIDSPKFNRMLASIAYCGNDQLVITGGLRSIKPTSQTILANLKTGTFQNLPEMHTERSEHSSVFLDSFLYVAGGIASELPINVLERFDFEKHRWTFEKPMNSSRTLFSMVVAHGLIYAIGGENDLHCLNSVEYYDPMTNDWMDTTPMIKPRASAGVAVFNNAIYMVGGSMTFRASETNTVERFDLDTKVWSLIASLNIARDHISCCVYQNSLIAAGGYVLDMDAVDFVEIYDEKENEWSYLQPLDRARGRSTMFVSSSDFGTAAAI